MNATHQQDPSGGQMDGAKDKTAEVTDQAKEKAGEAMDQAREQASTLASQAQDRARSEVDQRSTQAGEKVSGTASDLRSVGDSLRQEGKDGPARIADQAADRLEGVGSYLTDSDADRILHDVEDFGRRRPWAVLAGAAVVGIAAARFLKASSESRYSQRSGSTASVGEGHGAGAARELAGAGQRPTTSTQHSEGAVGEPVGAGA